MLLADAESCYSEEMAPASQSVTPSLSPSPPPPLPPQASTAARWTDLVPPHCQRCHLYTGSGNKGECVLFLLVCCGGFLKQWKSWDRPLVYQRPISRVLTLVSFLFCLRHELSLLPLSCLRYFHTSDPTGNRTLVMFW